MLKKNQFVLIFLTIVTILAVWYIKTPTTAQTNNDVSSDEELAETTRLAAFLEMRDVIRNERSLESAQYDSIIADEAKTIDDEIEIAVQVNGKTRTTIKIAKDIDKDSAIAAGKEALGDRLQGNIIKEIYVPGRIINIVAK